MRENTYQRKLIKKLEKQFPGCMVLKNDASEVLFYAGKYLPT
nr:MAG TPA: hypothetical protein [Caudoviricetes sp.]